MADTSVQSMPNGDLRAKEFDEVNSHQLSLQWRYGLADYLKGTEATTPPPSSIHRTIPNGNEVNPADAILPILYFPINQIIGNTSPLTLNPAVAYASDRNVRRLYVYKGDSLYTPTKTGWWLTYGNSNNSRALPFSGDYALNDNMYGNLPYVTKNWLNGTDKTFLNYIGGSNVTAYIGPRPVATISEIPYASVKDTIAVGSGLTTTQRNKVYVTNGSNKVSSNPTDFQQPLPFNIYFCGYYTDRVTFDGYNRLTPFWAFNDNNAFMPEVTTRAAFQIIPVNVQSFYYHDVRMKMVDVGLSTERFVMYFKRGTNVAQVNPTQFIEYEIHFYKDKNYIDVHYISSGTPVSFSLGNGIYYTPSTSGVFVTDSHSLIHSPMNYPGPKYFPGDQRAIRVTTSVNGYYAYTQAYELGKIVDSRTNSNSNTSQTEFQLQISNPQEYVFTESTFGSNTTIYSINIVKNVGLASKVSTNDYQVTGELDEVNYDWSASPGVKTIITPQGNLYVNGQFDEVNLNT